jgi:hypothetical protein
MMTTTLALLALTAWQQEVTLSVGAHGGGDKTTNAAWQANYSVGLRKGDKASLFGEVHLLASPNRKNQIANPQASRDEAALFLTPGLRVSFLPKGRLSPFLAGGYGWGSYEQSALLQNGAPFSGSRTTNHGAVQFGGGMDVKAFQWLAFRGDLRNFYSGGRHNPTVSIGFQLRFGER